MHQHMIVLLSRHIHHARRTPDHRFRRCLALEMDTQSWITRNAAARHAEVTEDVIKTWQYRGWINDKRERQKLTVQDGRYLLADVLKAERDTRRSGRSHRRLPPPSAYHPVSEVEKQTRRSPYGRPRSSVA